MKNWSDKDYLVFAGTDQNSYVQNHAYAVLAVKEEQVNGEMVRYMEMRNPWGSSNWSGAYSVNSPEWNALNAISPIDTEGGKFLIGFSDFMQQFPSVTMSMSAENRLHPNDPVEYRPRLKVGPNKSYTQVRLGADVDLNHDFFAIQNFQEGNLIGFARNPNNTLFTSGYLREKLTPLEGQSFDQRFDGWGSQ